MPRRQSIKSLSAKLLIFSLGSILLAPYPTGGYVAATQPQMNQTNTNGSEDSPDPDFAKQGRVVRRGVWGGEHLGLTVRSKDAKLEYDCAHGTIDQPLKTDRRGRFSARGTHTWESGGPDTRGSKPDTHPARYTGSVKGGRMVITVTLNDSNKVVGTFTLTYGDGPNIFKCK